MGEDAVVVVVRKTAALRRFSTNAATGPCVELCRLRQHSRLYLSVSRLVYGINGELIDVPLEPRAYLQGCVNPTGD